MPVIGLEAEFKVIVDGHGVEPEKLWRSPAAFIDQPMLRRGTKASQLPTGGAVYFDGGVIEVVTPVIEIAPQCTSRAVRSLWEQIGFVREQLDRWEARSGSRVRLEGFSCHFNVSFEIPRDERGRNRTVQKLAMLLAHLLPIPVIVVGTNRHSTGLGVRPRRERIEITLDFTPDPGLLAATTALIVGIVREIIGWPSYLVTELAARGLPVVDFSPGKHATRNGWVARDFHFPQNPFATDLDQEVWPMTDGRVMSMRQIALEIATFFRESISRHADPFSESLLFSVLTGETPSLLDLDDRPAAYDDVGHAARWGSAIPELHNYASLMHDDPTDSEPLRRRADVEERLAPPWRGEPLDRREHALLPPRTNQRSKERRASAAASQTPRLTRSQYETVFLELARGKTLRVGSELLTPIAVKGWYHAIFRTPRGDERLVSIDQLLDARWAE